MAKHVNVDHRIGEIRDMAKSGMPDEAIGDALGTNKAAIYRLRKQFGIPSNVKRGRKSTKAVFAAQEPVPAAGEPYIDADGNRVTPCPKRWAHGALIQGVTARSRR